MCMRSYALALTHGNPAMPGSVADRAGVAVPSPEIAVVEKREIVTAPVADARPGPIGASVVLARHEPVVVSAEPAVTESTRV